MPRSAHTLHIVATSPTTPGIVQRLGQILLKARVLTQDVLLDALSQYKTNRGKRGETLVAMAAASREDVRRALALQSGLPFMAAEELPSAPPIIKNLSPKYLGQYVSCPIAPEGSRGAGA